MMFVTGELTLRPPRWPGARWPPPRWPGARWPPLAIEGVAIEPLGGPHNALSLVLLLLAIAVVS